MNKSKEETKIKIAFKILILSILFFILRTIIFAGLFQQMFDLPTPSIESPGLLLLFNFLTCFVFTLAITPIVFRSTLSKTKLRWTLMSILIGIPILINQIEAFFFEGSVDMSQKELYIYSLGNICAAVVYTFVVTAIFDKKISTDTTAHSFLIARKQLFWKIPLAAGVVYPFIYLIFGTLLFILWPPAAAFYADIETPSMASVVVFQVFRGSLWMIPGLLIVAHTKGNLQSVFLTTGFVFAVFMSTEILAPVDFMPLEVRMGHFVELFLSHFLWGVVLVYMFRNPHDAQ